MSSLEDLRDMYKSSTKSKHLEIKTNGSTYSKVYKNEIYKRGNLVTKQVYGTNEDMTEIDRKYGINLSDLNYSLNKKGRWNMSKDLGQYIKNAKYDRELNNFENDDARDIRVYETRDRIRSSYDDCISFKRSKGEDLKINSTYANKDSIKRSLILEAQRERNPRVEEVPAQSLRNHRKSKQHKSTKRSNGENEHIIIDLNEYDENDDINDEYIEYEIKLPPTMEVLKYNTLFEHKRKDKVFSRVTKNILGDELNMKNIKELNYIDDFNNELYEDDNKNTEEESAYVFPEGKTINISFADLINNYTKPIMEKRKNDLIKFKPKCTSYNEKELRKLIYISRQASRIDNKHTESRNNVAVSTLLKTKEPIMEITIQIKESSLEKDHLKEKFGLRYYEALNAWPRMISISLNEDIINEIKTDVYDVKAWLTLRQVTSKKMSNSETINEYNLRLKTNFNEIVFDLHSIGLTDDFCEFDDIYSKIIKFIATQPLSLFKIKEKTVKQSLPNGTLQLMTELPNLATRSVCKEIDDIKFELLNKTIPKENDNEETNSDSSSLINELDVQVVNEKIDEMFDTKTASCPLCFESLPIDECTILLNCAHSVCNSCFGHYVDAFINTSNTGKLPCAVCDSELELAIVLEFVSDINKFEHYLISSINQIIAVTSDYKWCPSPNCNKAVKVDLSSTPFGILSCECGHRTCLKCNMEPHFPAKCSQLAKYYSELKAKSHFLLSKDSPIESCTGKKVNFLI